MGWIIDTLLRTPEESLRVNKNVEKYCFTACRVMAVIEMISDYGENLLAGGDDCKCEKLAIKDAIELFQASVDYVKNYIKHKNACKFLWKDGEVLGMANLVLTVYYVAFPDKIALGNEHFVTTMESYIEVLQKIEAMDAGDKPTEIEMQTLKEVHSFFDTLYKESSRRSFRWFMEGDEFEAHHLCPA